MYVIILRFLRCIDLKYSLNTCANVKMEILANDIDNKNYVFYDFKYFNIFVGN